MNSASSAGITPSVHSANVCAVQVNNVILNICCIILIFIDNIILLIVIINPSLLFINIIINDLSVSIKFLRFSAIFYHSTMISEIKLIA